MVSELTAERADSRQRIDAELVESLRRVARAYLERRVEELNDEVRHYPGPIARCDDQLTGLLEQRSRALAALQRLESLGSQPPTRADGVALAGEVVDLLQRR
jgi:hypothetical protein